MHTFRINKTAQQALLAGTLALLTLAPVASVFAAADPVVLTFSTVGDSRQDAASPDASAAVYTQPQPATQVTPGTNCPVTTTPGTAPNPGISAQDCKWLQNTNAFATIIRNIQAQKSNLLFFNGDMTLGYGLADIPVTRASSVSIAKPTATAPYPVDSETPTALAISTPASIGAIVNSDLMQYYQQYGFWRGMIAGLIETGTYVVPVPGNHETQCKRCGKKSQWQNENAWRDNMGDLIIDQTRINNALSAVGASFNTSTWSLTNYPGVADGLITSQQGLSYSFDVGNNHFSVINTDPVGNDSHAPTNWLDADLTAAVSNGAQHLFVFGHKPAYYYSYAGASGISAASSLFLTDQPAADAFWAVITKHNATYFAGHEHIYNVSQPTDNTHTTGGTAYQVIVGAGGSPFDDLESTPTQTFPTGTLTSDRMYSWATVSIHQSGQVTLNTYGFLPTLNSRNTNTNPVVQLGSFSLPAAK